MFNEDVQAVLKRLPDKCLDTRACTKRGDDCNILFVGIESELTRCNKLERNFISAKLHQEYYKAITQKVFESPIVAVSFVVKNDFSQRVFTT